MKLSVELVDLVFSFLISHRNSLLACSQVPELSQIVERHLYHTITVSFQPSTILWRDSSASSNPTVLSKFVSENPRILHYVRVLQIQVLLGQRRDDLDIKQDLDNFAKTLLLFHGLECIKLTTSKKRLCRWPDIFRAA